MKEVNLTGQEWIKVHHTHTKNIVCIIQPIYHLPTPHESALHGALVQSPDEVHPSCDFSSHATHLAMWLTLTRAKWIPQNMACSAYNALTLKAKFLFWLKLTAAGNCGPHGHVTDAPLSAHWSPGGGGDLVKLYCQRKTLPGEVRSNVLTTDEHTPTPLNTERREDDYSDTILLYSDS